MFLRENDTSILDKEIALAKEIKEKLNQAIEKTNEIIRLLK